MESPLRSSSFSGSALKALAVAEATCEEVAQVEAVEQVHIVQMYLVVQQTTLLLQQFSQQ